MQMCLDAVNRCRKEVMAIETIASDLRQELIQALIGTERLECGLLERLIVLTNDLQFLKNTVARQMRNRETSRGSPCSRLK
jgi:hypothetical protein